MKEVMKPQHKTIKDFPNLFTAKKYIEELKMRIAEMQRKIDKAAYDFDVKRIRADTDWLRRLKTAHKCCVDEMITLVDAVKAIEKAEKQRQADFYWNFYELAKITLNRTAFDLLQKGARDRLNRPIDGDSSQNFMEV